MALLSILLLLGGSSCSMFRGEIGLGTGFGVVAKVPAVLHAGLGGGEFAYMGHDYGAAGWHMPRSSLPYDGEGALVLPHFSDRRSRPVVGEIMTSNPGDTVTWNAKGSHSCWGLLPALTEGDRESYPLEIDVYLFFVSVRLGFNPTF
jgi:hypothetical protein